MLFTRYTSSQRTLSHMLYRRALFHMLLTINIMVPKSAIYWIIASFFYDSCFTCKTYCDYHIICRSVSGIPGSSGSLSRPRRGFDVVPSPTVVAHLKRKKATQITCFTNGFLLSAISRHAFSGQILIS